jgi:hypothetical protein
MGMNAKASKIARLYERVDQVRSQHIDRELILLNRLIAADELLKKWLEESSESPLARLTQQYLNNQE